MQAPSGERETAERPERIPADARGGGSVGPIIAAVDSLLAETEDAERADALRRIRGILAASDPPEPPRTES